MIDQALDLFGHPLEIYADIRTQRAQVEVDDNFELILYYDRLKVTLKAGMLVKERLPKYILLGDQGSFVKYGMDVQEAQSRSGQMPDDVDWGIEPEEDWGVINFIEASDDVREKIPSEQGDYISFYEEIYKAIAEGNKSSLTAVDGYNTVRVIEAAIESNSLGKRIRITEML